MNRIVTLIMMLLFAVAPVGSARAQWDSRDCSAYGTNLEYPETLESSLWTFRSNVWDGYIDFQEGGKYWSPAGNGTWTVSDRKIHMTSSNSRTYEIELTDNGFRYEGVRSDGLRVSGALLCAHYQGRGPQVPEEVAKQITKNFKANMERNPTQKELDAQFRQYLQGASVEAVRDSLMTTQEFKVKAAQRAAEQAKNPEGQLGW